METRVRGTGQNTVASLREDQTCPEHVRSRAARIQLRPGYRYHAAYDLLLHLLRSFWDRPSRSSLPILLLQLHMADYWPHHTDQSRRDAVRNREKH